MERLTYMEIYTQFGIIYRVVTVCRRGVTFYGVEAENGSKREGIYEFSKTPEKAMSFAEKLVENRNTPSQIYSLALNFLGANIKGT